MLSPGPPSTCGLPRSDVNRIQTRLPPARPRGIDMFHAKIYRRVSGDYHHTVLLPENHIQYALEESHINEWIHDSTTRHMENK